MYEDRVSIETPEGVRLELILAGVGSRMTATLIDLILQIAAILAVLLLAHTAGGSLPTAFASVATFLVFFGYDILFETFASGRTLGKRWTHLRVVRVGGQPVTFLVSSVRNLLRVVDFLPALYAVGVVTIVLTGRNQRLGDLAAGTYIVRERRAEALPAWAQENTTTARPEYASWDVSAVTQDDVVVIRRFLDRRSSLPPETRARLSRQIAGPLRDKVVAPMAGEYTHPELFLEAVAAAKAERR